MTKHKWCEHMNETTQISFFKNRNHIPIETIYRSPCDDIQYCPICGTKKPNPQITDKKDAMKEVVKHLEKAHYYFSDLIEQLKRSGKI